VLAAEIPNTRKPCEASGGNRGGVHGDHQGGDEQVLDWSGLPLTSRLAIGSWVIRREW
jgi:hypothetical protein